MVAEGMDFSSLRTPATTVDQYIDRYTPPNDIDLNGSNRINFEHYGAITAIIFSRLAQLLGLGGPML